MEKLLIMLKQGSIVKGPRKQIDLISRLGLPKQLRAAFGTEVPNAVRVTSLTRLGPVFRWIGCCDPEARPLYRDEWRLECSRRSLASVAIAVAALHNRALRFIPDLTAVALTCNRVHTQLLSPVVY